MIYFKVSAPSKINLLGESLACDDHNGVMASTNRRTTVKFNELLRLKDTIKLEYREINLNCMICLREFRKFYKSCTFDDTLPNQIPQFISKHLWDNEHQKMITHILIYLLVYVTYKEEIDIEDVTPFQVYLETPLLSVHYSNLASFVVCLTTCLLHWSNLRKTANHKLNDNDRAKISMYSKSCDKIFTYCMFKADVTVSTYGFMLRYHCKDSSQNDVLDNMPRMRVLMIDSTVNLVRTKVTKVKELMRNCCPQIENSIIDTIRVISEKAFSVLKKIRDMNKKTDTYSQDVWAQEKKLFPLIRVQQILNRILLEFNDETINIYEIARRYNLPGKCADFYNARYTYIWCPSEGNIQEMNKDMMLMKKEFISNGFKVKLIYLNCDGVKIE